MRKFKMSITRCVNKNLDGCCPELKLIIVLGILGIGIGALTGCIKKGDTFGLSDNKAAVATICAILGLIAGTLSGKVIGIVSHCAGLGFFSPESETQEANERAPLNPTP